jgi:hypothetical protein
MKLMTILTTVLLLTLTSCAHNKSCKKSCDSKDKKSCEMKDKKSCDLKKKDKKKSMACCAKKS